MIGPFQSHNNKNTVRHERGQSLAELAFALPLFLVLIVGVVEVASVMNSYVTVINAARDGARLGSKGAASDDEIKTLVLTEGDRLRDPIDPTHDISVDRIEVGGADAVKVEVCNDHSLIMGVPLLLPDEFRMCSSTVMRTNPDIN